MADRGVAQGESSREHQAWGRGGVRGSATSDCAYDEQADKKTDKQAAGHRES